MTVRLAYSEFGASQSGTPVVLVHAFPLSRVMFDEVATSLADRRRVIVPDLRGFGDSPGPGSDEPSVEAMADDVVALLDHLGIRRCVLGGLSLGGYVAMAMMRAYRERIEAVVLMDTKASADTDEGRANRERIAQAVLDHGTRALRPMLETLLGATTRARRPEVVARVTGWLDEVDPAAVAWAQRAMAARPDSFGTLAEAGAADGERPGVRGFVVVGEEDMVTTHDDALAMAAAFTPHAPVHVIADTGHLSAVENADAVAGALRDVVRHLPWESSTSSPSTTSSSPLPAGAGASIPGTPTPPRRLRSWLR